MRQCLLLSFIFYLTVVLLVADRCILLNSYKRGNFTKHAEVLHCGEGHAGYFDVKLNNMTGALFRGRISGFNSIVPLKASQKSHNIWIFEYNIPAGIYGVQLDLRFSSFDFENFMFRAPFFEESFIYNYSFSVPFLSKICPFGASNIQGSWSNGILDSEWILFSGNKKENTNERTIPLQSLKYSPKGCSLISETEFKKCVEGKHPWKKTTVVCAVGDSHARHLINSIVDVIEQSGAGYLYPSSSNTDYTVADMHYTRPYVHLFSDDYGTCIFDDTLRCGNPDCLNHLHELSSGKLSCSAMLINFGHWVSSFQVTLFLVFLKCIR